MRRPRPERKNCDDGCDPRPSKRSCSRPTAADARVFADPTPCLPDEILWLVLSLCDAQTLCAAGRADHRTRRVAMDGRLWKRLYEKAFPPCATGSCLARLGAIATHLDADPTATAEALIDRLLDASNEALDPDPHRHLGSWSDLVIAEPSSLRSCLHHWPEVMEACGHRWAYAVSVAAAGRPRHFGLAPAVPLRLVGAVAMPPCDKKGPDAAYRGDLVPGTGAGRFVPSGYGTATGPLLRTGQDLHSPLVRCASGRWKNGTPCGRIAAWSDVDPSRPGRSASRHSIGDIHDQCGALDGFYSGHWGPSGPHGAGVLFGRRRVGVGEWASGVLKTGRSWCLVPYVDAPLPRTERTFWSIADFERGWSTTRPDPPPIRGASHRPTGIGWRGASHRADGIIRGPSGRVAFSGVLCDGWPLHGRLFDAGGRTVYEGAFHHGVVSHGRLAIRDGLTAYSERWDRSVEGGDLLLSESGFVVRFEATGDQFRMRHEGDPSTDSPLPIVSFIYGDGRAVPQPPLGWEVISVPPLPDPAKTADIRGQSPGDAVLCETCLPGGRSRLLTAEAREALVPSVFFWPRSAAALDFVDYMAVHHPGWDRCRAAVRALYGAAAVPTS